MKPEAALEHARRELARRRAAGAYDDDLDRLKLPPPEPPSLELLLEWALIEPDMELVTSTRRFGAPIGMLKRGILHLLRQYTGQLASQQTRMNVHLITRLGELDDRLADLEQRVSGLERP